MKDIMFGVLCVGFAVMAFEYHSMIAGFVSAVCLLELIMGD